MTTPYKAITVPEALDVLRQALEDEGYRRGWQANIACAFQDEWQRAANDGGLPATPDQIHKISNKAATYFLSLLCTSGEGRTFKMFKDLYASGEDKINE